LGMIILDEPGKRVRWPELRQGLIDFFAIPWRNFKAIFTKAGADWSGFGQAIDLVIMPYFIGGLIPGFLIALVGYLLSKPLVVAYQNRRKGRLAGRLKKIREAAVEKFEQRKEKKDGK